MPHETTRPLRPIRKRRLSGRSAFRQAVESCHEILKRKAIPGQHEFERYPCQCPRCTARTQRFFRVGSREYFLCYAHRSLKVLAKIIARKLWRERPR